MNTLRPLRGVRLAGLVRGVRVLDLLALARPAQVLQAVVGRVVVDVVHGVLVVPLGEGEGALHVHMDEVLYAVDDDAEGGFEAPDGGDPRGFVRLPHFAHEHGHFVRICGIQWVCVGRDPLMLQHGVRVDAREAFKMDTVVFEAVGFEVGHTCVPSKMCGRDHPLACLVFVSFLNFRKERRSKQARGLLPYPPVGVHMCDPPNPIDTRGRCPGGSRSSSPVPGTRGDFGAA